MPAGRFEPSLSIVVPAFNEAASLERLLDEIREAMRDHGCYEVICVDDASTDETPVQLGHLARTRPWLRHVTHELRSGKSAAIWTGVLAATAPVIVTLDADGRNNPAVIPHMVTELAAAGPACGLVAGQRVGRYDSALTRLRSKIANSVRDALLDDGTRDTTCGLKCFPRSVFLDLPYFDGLHRFLPALIRRDGYAVSLIDVVDRPSWKPSPRRTLFGGLGHATWDLLGVSWLIHRRGPTPSVLAETGGLVPPVEHGTGDPGRPG